MSNSSSSLDLTHALKLLLDRGASPNFPTDESSKRTLLHLTCAEALKTSDYSRVDLLLAHPSANPGIRCSSEPEDNCLDLGVRAGDVELCRRVLRKAPGLANCSRPLTGVTPLHDAVFGDQTAIAGLLLLYGANVNAEDRYGGGPLFFCQSAEMAKMLVGEGADLGALNAKGESVLHAAAYILSSSTLNLLIMHPAYWRK